MTNFISTRDNTILIDSKTAIINGLSKDGGLYIPSVIPTIDNIYRLKDLEYRDLAYEIISLFFNDLDQDELRKAINESYSSNFESKDITPLKKVGNDYFLELYHGPTSAFKDIALQFLPRILTMVKNDKDIVILSATSGDTGKAALEGFKDVKGTKIKVLYPYKKVSLIQERQMSTTLGSNTEVIAVNGNFDDCQNLVKDIMENETFDNINLSSANSINIARLIPQIVYYFKAYFDLLNNNEITKDEEIDFIVPTGNFGDILAGYFAKCMGLKINKLVLASNTNDVLVNFINTGVYDANRELIQTMSPSIDILISSNLERLLYLKSNDSSLVKDLMLKIKKDRYYEIPLSLKESIQKDFVAIKTNEDECKNTIKKYYDNYHYLIDTHTSIAAGVLDKYESNYKKVVLSTASPYKFSKDVYKSLTNIDIPDDLNALDTLYNYTQIDIPSNLNNLKNLQVRFDEVINSDDRDILINKLKENK